MYATATLWHSHSNRALKQLHVLVVSDLLQESIHAKARWDPSHFMLLQLESF